MGPPTHVEIDPVKKVAFLSLKLVSKIWACMRLPVLLVPPSLRGQDQRSPRSAHRREALPSSYLQAGYSATSYAPAPPSESYIDPQRLSSNYIPPSTDNQNYLSPQSPIYSRPNMGCVYSVQRLCPSTYIAFDAGTHMRKTPFALPARTSLPDLQRRQVSYCTVLAS